MKISMISEVLENIRRAGQFRQISDLRMVSASRGVDRTGKEFLVFNSNDYLGMTHEPAVIEASRAALQWGSGSGGARLTSGASFEMSDLEAALARFKHKEAALLFNTGYMTNLGVLYALAGSEDVIFSDSLNHASIVDGCRISKSRVVVYKHSDMADLARKLEETPCSGQRFLVTDGVFSMDGDVALPELIPLKKKYGACLIVDDAHATGVIGETGHGTAEFWGLDGIDIQVGTLSKALGAEGGFVAASREIIDFLRNRSRPFIFSTAIGPATTAAALRALALLEEAPEQYVGRLRQNTQIMRQILTDAGLPLLPGPTPILPIVMGGEEETVAYAAACRKAGLLLSAIRPPSVPKGTSRIRLTVTAAHTEEEIRQACEILIGNWSQKIKN